MTWKHKTSDSGTRPERRDLTPMFTGSAPRLFLSFPTLALQLLGRYNGDINVSVWSAAVLHRNSTANFHPAPWRRRRCVGVGAALLTALTCVGLDSAHTL